jgi:hypothetical protein
VDLQGNVHTKKKKCPTKETPKILKVLISDRRFIASEEGVKIS